MHLSRWRTSGGALVLALLAGGTSAGAQQPRSRDAFGDAPLTFRTVGNEFRIGVEDILFIWSSPFRAEWRDMEALGAVALATVAVGAFDEQIDRELTRRGSFVRRGLGPLREDSDTPFFYDLATGRRINPISGALYLGGVVLRKPALREAGMGCASAYWANSTVRHVVYQTVVRPRPVTNPRNPYFMKYDWGSDVELHSFFGGHAANAITCFTFANHRWDLGYAEPVLYTLGVGLSVVRMVDRRHWGSDTVIGMAFGYAIGKAVADRYEKRDAAIARAAGGGSGAEGDGAAATGDTSSRPPGLALLILDGLHAEQRGGVSYVGWRASF